MEKAYKCLFCEYSSTQPYNMKRHVAVHIGTVIQCSYCDAKYHSNGALRMHMRQKHNIERKGVCKCVFCGTLFDSVITLKTHLTTDHGSANKEESAYQCGQCDRVFQQASSLYGHLHTHND